MEDNLPKLGTKSNECTVDAFLRYFPIHFCTENKVALRRGMSRFSIGLLITVHLVLSLVVKGVCVGDD